MKHWLVCTMLFSAVCFAQVHSEFPMRATAFLKVGNAYLIYTEVGLPYLRKEDAIDPGERSIFWDVMVPLETLANFGTSSLQYTEDCHTVTITSTSNGSTTQQTLSPRTQLA